MAAQTRKEAWTKSYVGSQIKVALGTTLTERAWIDRERRSSHSEPVKSVTDDKDDTTAPRKGMCVGVMSWQLWPSESPLQQDFTLCHDSSGVPACFGNYTTWKSRVWYARRAQARVVTSMKNSTHRLTAFLSLIHQDGRRYQSVDIKVGSPPKEA